MLINMINITLKTGISFLTALLLTACNHNMERADTYKSVGTNEYLYVYDDGSMMFKERYLNDEDVIIYADGKGGEKAAVKVRVPIHPDFYRDSIIVVRVINISNDAVVKSEQEKSPDQNL